MLRNLREHRQRSEPARRYQMREKLIAIGDDYWIETADGQRAFKVDGKALRLRKTLHFEDAHGRVLYQIQQRLMRVRDTMAIERDGETIATVRKALVRVLRDRFTIELAAGTELAAQGHVLDHEYEISQDGHQVAKVSKQWLRIRDTYTVDVEPGQDDALILAITVCLDQMAQEKR
jgi:uncharacterized protein YxjI